MRPRQFDGSFEARETDRVCDRFEKAWRTGLRPRIEDFVQGQQEPQRSRLLRELLLLELDLHSITKTPPTLVEYCKRFPGNESLVHDVFVEAGRATGLAQSDSTTVTLGQLMGEAGYGLRNEGSDSLETADSADERYDSETQIGRYHVVSFLGKGGFGKVYLARDNELQRDVALKLPRRVLVSNDEAAKRYLAEARVVAKLDHPHIVPVYDVGGSEDHPFWIVSKFIAGKNLAKTLREARPSHEASAEIVAAVAEAVHYAVSWLMPRYK